MVENPSLLRLGLREALEKVEGNGKFLKTCDKFNMAERRNVQDSLYDAICDGDFLYVKFCVENGANINAKDLRYGFSFLHWAIVYGNLEIAKFLLQDHRFLNGANINAKDNNGLSPLHNAVFCFLRSKSHCEIFEKGRGTG